MRKFFAKWLSHLFTSDQVSDQQSPLALHYRVGGGGGEGIFYQEL